MTHDFRQNRHFGDGRLNAWIQTAAMPALPIRGASGKEHDTANAGAVQVQDASLQQAARASRALG